MTAIAKIAALASAAAVIFTFPALTAPSSMECSDDEKQMRADCARQCVRSSKTKELQQECIAVCKKVICPER
jgi:hypothetical protein